MDVITEHAHQSIKQGSRSFSLASKFLPKRYRDDVAMLYAWCRYCDDVIDGQEMGHGQISDYKHGQLDRLSYLNKRTAEALSGKFMNDPIFDGLAKVINNNCIDHKYPNELLRGFSMDANCRVYRTVDDILDYSYYVAGVVGVMIAKIMGITDEDVLDRACDLGIAFQLTNIARDIMDDAKADRVFVPQSLFHDKGIKGTVKELLDQRNLPIIHEAVIVQLSLADRYYRSSKAGIKALPFRCSWAMYAALNVYSDIGSRIKKQGPSAWSNRVSSSHLRKLYLSFLALFSIFLNKTAVDVSRENLYQRPR
jgi:phytoene synthase